MIGQSLLEFGWLEPVPNARDGGTVFKDEYVLYQPGVVNSKKKLVIFGSIIMCTKGYQISAHRFHILTEINLEFLRKWKKKQLLTKSQ